MPPAASSSFAASTVSPACADDDGIVGDSAGSGVRSSGQLTKMKAPGRRDAVCSSRATASLPAPGGPTSSSGSVRPASRTTASLNAWTAALSPSNGPSTRLRASLSSSCATRSSRWSAAVRSATRASSDSFATFRSSAVRRRSSYNCALRIALAIWLATIRTSPRSSASKVCGTALSIENTPISSSLISSGMAI